MARWFVQRITGAGLLGEIAIGMIFGSPLAQWLDVDWQSTMVIVGYIGLLAIVLEGVSSTSQKKRRLSCIIDAMHLGGITTSLPLLIPLIPISMAIAFTGVAGTLALSFLCVPAFGYSPLSAFASGAAMSSTSLGTTLAVLAGTKGIGFDLRQTKVGVALVGAAVADDVVAFVFSEIMKILGQSEGGVGPQIGRIVGVTIGLGAVAIPLTIWVLKPLLTSQRSKKLLFQSGRLGSMGVILLVAIGMVAAAGYAGTSPLYGIYVGGLMLSYVSEPDENTAETTSNSDIPLTRFSTNPTPDAGSGGQAPKPIPMAYTLSRQSLDLSRAHTHPGTVGYHFAYLPSPARARRPAPAGSDDRPNPLDFASTYNAFLFPLVEYILLPIFFGSIGYSIPFLRLWRGSIIWKGIVYSIWMVLGKLMCGLWLFWPSKSKGGKISEAQGLPVTEEEEKGEWTWKDRVPAVLFLGFAMVARGEIGLLISQIGRHTPTPLLDEDAFLIAIWAIVVNTIIGPVAVSSILKKWRVGVVRGGWE